MPDVDLQHQLETLYAENLRLKQELDGMKYQTMQLAKMEALREFIGDMSHDLRTPISVIKTSTYLLRNTHDAEKRTRHLHILEMQVEHLENLVDDLVTMSRLDANMTTFHIRRVRMNELINDLMDTIFPIAIDKGLTVEVDSPQENLPLVMVDKLKMSRALLHILQNAVNYTPSGGAIHVRCYPRGDYVCAEISDTGIGIASSDLPHIFDRFYRADRARSTSTGNVGLGLTIARKIIERHQGYVEVESEPGRGSNFRVYLKAL